MVSNINIHISDYMIRYFLLGNVNVIFVVIVEKIC